VRQKHFELVDRHKVNIVHDNERIAASVFARATQNQLRFQFLARARKLAAGEADQTPSAIVGCTKLLDRRTNALSIHASVERNIALDS